jgi:hypothetical protein
MQPCAWFDLLCIYLRICVYTYMYCTCNRFLIAERSHFCRDQHSLIWQVTHTFTFTFYFRQTVQLIWYVFIYMHTKTTQHTLSHSKCNHVRGLICYVSIFVFACIHVHAPATHEINWKKKKNKKKTWIDWKSSTSSMHTYMHVSMYNTCKTQNMRLTSSMHTYSIHTRTSVAYMHTCTDTKDKKKLDKKKISLQAMQNLPVTKCRDCRWPSAGYAGGSDPEFQGPHTKDFEYVHDIWCMCIYTHACVYIHLEDVKRDSSNVHTYIHAYTCKHT